MTEVGDVVAALVGTGLWSDKAARLGLRAGFSCEYCGADLLASVDAYVGWEVDHIIPREDPRVPTPESEAFYNKAIACRTCNRIKRRWDPRREVGDDASRSELIRVGRRYIERKRTEKLIEVAEMRRLAHEARWLPLEPPSPPAPLP